MRMEIPKARIPVDEDWTTPWKVAFELRHQEPEVVVLPKKKAPVKKARKLSERAVTFLNGYCYGGITVLLVVAAVLLALGVL